MISCGKFIFDLLRLRVSLRRMQDRDIDNLSNPHEVKHWMDPKLIPYGWGLFDGLDISEELGSSSLIFYS